VIFLTVSTVARTLDVSLALSREKFLFQEPEIVRQCFWNVINFFPG
jgi:hypothetical protein